MAKDRIAGLILLIFSAFFYYRSTLIDVKDLTGLQATFFPRVLLGLIAILAIIMIIQSFRKKEGKEPNENNQNQKEWIVWAVFALFGLYILLLEFIGFVIASFLFVAIVYLIILSKKKPMKKHALPLLGLLGIIIGLQIVFERFLNVFLPEGIFF